MSASLAPASVETALPPLAPIKSHAPLGDETLAAWRAAFVEINRGIEKLSSHSSIFAHSDTKLHPVSPAKIDETFAALQSPLPIDPETLPNEMWHLVWRKESGLLLAFWSRPEVELVHVLRFAILIGCFGRQSSKMQPIFGCWFHQCLSSFRMSRPKVGLREVAAGFRAVGLDPEQLGRHQLSAFSWDPFSWGAERIWPYWAENLNVLWEYFHSDERFYSTYWRRNALNVLQLFPLPPERFAETLWNLALGSAKTERAAAQRCLRNVANKLDRTLAALAGGKAESRAAAADWLRQMRDQAAVKPLIAAVRNEKNEVAKGAMMFALEQLGVPVEQFLDRKTLRAEADKGLAKGTPAPLEWFPFDLLPPVHWADKGKRVEPAILRWWLVQQCKLKNAEPGPLLRRYCSSFREGDREALAQFVLDAWIANDTAPISREQAESGARRHAQAMLASAQWMVQHAQQHPQIYQAPPPAPKALEQYYTEALPAFLQRPKGSGIDSKGILAIAGACGGAGLASTVQRYLKQWYGMRPAQCRALLQMLAWVEHPSATQVLLATGSRFRTKGIQEEANKQVHALAERKGWTLDELGDRTVPTAGLDEDGVLELDFGPRRFTAKLNGALEFVLFDPDGKPLKALPDPRRDDDEALASSAKKLFSNAKKELKGVLSMQRDRFYAAMCSQRQWRFADWELFVNRHPILRHLTQRLVWAVLRDGAASFCFRPLPDGSLTDTEDGSVELGAEEIIVLAHEHHATPAVSRAWLDHLNDYAVEPLFEQFGKPVFRASDAQKNETESTLFEGHVVESFKLRGRATKFGYTRGQAQDGGWFYEYTRRLPSLGLEAVIEFTGNSLPEENRPVALRAFYFQHLPPPGQPGGQMHTPARVKVGEVPPVLLSECWNDLRQLAAEGSGFDPEWEKKIGM